MKKLLTLTIVGAFMAGTATVGFAQGAGPKGGKAPGVGGQNGKGKPGQGAGQRFVGMRKMQEEILAKLNLSDKQKAAIKALNDKQRAEIEKMRNSGADPKANREKFMAMRKAHQDAFMKILTPQQQATYKKALEEMRAKWQKERGGPGGPGSGKKPGTPPPTKPGG